MSASLVGSEMCIRDSKGNRPSAVVSALGRMASGILRARMRGCVWTGSNPCLLYTSDAADDM
eukprot:10651202-Alexandrium_andersonii.AAC.1